MSETMLNMCPGLLTYLSRQGNNLGSIHLALILELVNEEEEGKVICPGSYSLSFWD